MCKRTGAQIDALRLANQNMCQPGKAKLDYVLLSPLYASQATAKEKIRCLLL